MSKLLYIESSPRKDRSISIAVAEEFLNAYYIANPSDKIDKIDLWNFPLPEFDGDIIKAKYAILHDQEPTPEQADAWQEVVDLADRFRSADKYLFSLPMWNFSVPYKLKQFIDVLTQPGLTFSYSEETGYDGLVKRKPAAIICSRGGEYPEGTSWKSYDFQKPYMETWLEFIGFTEIHTILIEATLDPKRVDGAKRLAIKQAQELGTHFYYGATVSAGKCF